MHPVVLCMSPQAKIEMGAFNQGHINQKSSTVVKWQKELRQFSLLQFDDFIKYDFSIIIFSSNACHGLFCEIRLRMCHTPDLFPDMRGRNLFRLELELNAEINTTDSDQTGNPARFIMK